MRGRAGHGEEGDGAEALHRVLRSSELPLERSGQGHATARIRRDAIATTVPFPSVRRMEVGGSEVLLARLPTGEVVAFDAYCPHQKTPLDHGTLYEGNLRCPQHNYVYDLRTGENVLPAREARPEALWKLKPGYLQTYPVVEKDGWIWVSEKPNPQPASYDPSAEAKPPIHRRRRPPSPAVQLQQAAPVEHPAESVDAELGVEFHLVLPTQPVPGHIWRLETTGDAIAVLGQTFEPGELVQYRVLVSACAPGAVTVRCLYAKPWGSDAKEIRTFHISVRSS